MSTDISGIGFGNLTFKSSVKVTDWGDTSTGERNDCYWNIAKNVAGEGASNAEIEEIMTQIAEAQVGEASTQEKLNQTLQTGDEVIIPLEAQVKTLTNSVKEATSARAELTNNLSSATTKLADANKACSEAYSAYMSATQAVDEDGNVKDESALQGAYEKYCAALQAVEDAQKEVKEIEEQIEAADKQIADLNEALKSTQEDISSTQDSIEEETKALQSEIEAYQKEAENADKALAEAKQKAKEESVQNMNNAMYESGVISDTRKGVPHNDDGTLKFNNLDTALQKKQTYDGFKDGDANNMENPLDASISPNNVPNVTAPGNNQDSSIELGNEAGEGFSQEYIDMLQDPNSIYASDFIDKQFSKWREAKQDILVGGISSDKIAQRESDKEVAEKNINAYKETVDMLQEDGIKAFISKGTNDAQIAEILQKTSQLTSNMQFKQLFLDMVQNQNIEPDVAKQKIENSIKTAVKDAELVVKSNNAIDTLTPAQAVFLEQNNADDLTQLINYQTGVNSYDTERYNYYAEYTNEQIDNVYNPTFDRVVEARDGMTEQILKNRPESMQDVNQVNDFIKAYNTLMKDEYSNVDGIKAIRKDAKLYLEYLSGKTVNPQFTYDTLISNMNKIAPWK